MISIYCSSKANKVNEKYAQIVQLLLNFNWSRWWKWSRSGLKGFFLLNNLVIKSLNISIPGMHSNKKISSTDLMLLNFELYADIIKIPKIVAIK